MNLGYIDLKRGIVAGLLSGVLWGWLVLAVNGITGAFSPGERLLFNLLTFAIGGGVFGVAVGGLLALIRDILPFKSLLPKAVLVSVCLWTVLRIGGAVLSGTAPWRYHAEMVQTVQGFFLAVFMGALLGVLWERVVKEV
jgi:hypothetical protein